MSPARRSAPRARCTLDLGELSSLASSLTPTPSGNEPSRLSMASTRSEPFRTFVPCSTSSRLHTSLTLTRFPSSDVLKGHYTHYSLLRNNVPIIRTGRTRGEESTGLAVWQSFGSDDPNTAIGLLKAHRLTPVGGEEATRKLFALGLG